MFVIIKKSSNTHNAVKTALITAWKKKEYFSLEICFGETTKSARRCYATLKGAEHKNTIDMEFTN